MKKTGLEFAVFRDGDLQQDFIVTSHNLTKKLLKKLAKKTDCVSDFKEKLSALSSIKTLKTSDFGVENIDSIDPSLLLENRFIASEDCQAVLVIEGEKVIHCIRKFDLVKLLE